MCLAISYKDSYPGEKGYKVLKKDERSYFTGLCGYPRMQISRTRYADARPTGAYSGILGGEGFDGFIYPFGFHILTSLEDARKLKRAEEKRNPIVKFVICEVAFKEQVAYGAVKWHYTGNKSFATDTVVARKCKIIKEVE